MCLSRGVSSLQGEEVKETFLKKLLKKDGGFKHHWIKAIHDLLTFKISYTVDDFLEPLLVSS